MKHFIFSLTLLLLSIFVFAQEEKPETNESKLKETTDAIKTKTSGGSRDRVVLEMMFDNWLHKQDGLKVRWYSRGFNAYFMYDIELGKSKFSFAPGVGVSTSSIFTNSALVKDSTGLSLVERTDEYKKNKIGLTYVDIPLELRFRASPNAKNKSFKFALGFKAGVLADGKTKLKQEDAFGDMKIYKEKRYPDFQRFRYGATFRIGYGPFNVVAYYQLSNVFKNNMGPDVTPISIGISINGL